jgi:hypothetical protein
VKVERFNRKRKGPSVLRSLFRLVILGLDLEVSLWVVADRTYIGRLLADDDVSTVGALPDDITIL